MRDAKALAMYVSTPELMSALSQSAVLGEWAPAPEDALPMSSLWARPVGTSRKADHSTAPYQPTSAAISANCARLCRPIELLIWTSNL